MSPPATVPIRPIRVLVADDSVGIRELLVLLLDMEVGFSVAGQARDGIEAVDRAQQLQPDLIVLDVSMPRLDGIAALPQVRAACPQARVVVFTGDTDASMEHEAHAAGAVAVISKEVGAMTLIDQLRALCETTVDAQQLPAAG